MIRFLCFLLILVVPQPLYAEEGNENFRSTTFPLPRFVSLRADEVYVRAGPGKKYPVEWVFKKASLPVEIILEYENWRKIKDYEGQSGWVHHSLLSGKRTAIVKADGYTPVYKSKSRNNGLSVKLEQKVVVELTECERELCKINAAGFVGWIEKSALWGVYVHEKFD